MPGQRAKGQKLLNFAADEEFIRQIDEAAMRAGHGNRSQFIRDAIFEKLERMGISLQKELKAAPPRTASREQMIASVARQATIRARLLTGAEPPPLHVVEGQNEVSPAGESAQGPAEESAAAQPPVRRPRQRG